MTFSLIEHGQLDWSEAQDLLRDATCAWADLDGFHIAGVPATPPHTTHLWACTRTSAFRCYVEGSTVIIGELREGPVGDRPEVFVTEHKGVPWGDIARVQPTATDGRDLRTLVSTVLDLKGLRRGRFYRFSAEGEDSSS